MFTVCAETPINVHVKCPLLYNFNPCFDVSVDWNSSLQFLKNHFAFLVCYMWGDMAELMVLQELMFCMLCSYHFFSVYSVVWKSQAMAKMWARHY